MNANLSRLSFGTYNKSGQLLDLALRQAIGEAGAQIFLVDTASKYLHGNQDHVARVLREHPHVQAGSKVNRSGHVREDLEEMLNLFPSLHRVLLHRPMSLSNWQVLERAKKEGKVQEIGVSNYSVEKLEQLLAECELQPDVVQNELHPCIDTQVPDLCQKKGIRFEAHSVMAANSYLLPAAKKLGLSPAQLAVSYCLARGADVCFSTRNIQHLRDVLQVPDLLTSKLDQIELLELGKLAFVNPIRLYRSQGTLNSDADMLYHRLVKDVTAFNTGSAFSDTCLSVHKTFCGQHAETSKLLACKFFPNEAESVAWQKFNGLMSKMRKVVNLRLEKVRRAKQDAFPKVCKYPRAAVEFPDALPVEIPDPHCFDAFLRELNDTAKTGVVEYPWQTERGSLFSDGRMDLCKQVIQPRFGELCDAVGKTRLVRHFLLGNNVIFRDGPNEAISERLSALVRLLQKDPEIETWYLAGNYIGPELSKELADAFKTASHTKALWLKMNPVKAGAFYFGEMAGTHHGLELLDLFMTGLCDEGIRAFRDGLQSQGGSKTLKHLYISVNDITDGTAVAEVVELLPNLESLFLGVNLLGDEGAALVLDKLRLCKSLRRLEFGANNLTDVSLPAILQLAQSVPQLQSLTLGSYKSTDFFAGKHNRFSDANLIAQIASHLEFLDIDKGVEDVDFEVLEQGLHSCAPNCFTFAVKGLTPGSKTTLVVGEGDLHERKQIANPQPFIDHIESVYRNKM